MSFHGKSEAGDRARYGDGFVTDNGGFFVELAVFADVHVARGFTWCNLTVIEEGGLAVREANQHEAAAAYIARSGLDDGEGERHGDGRIDCVAAALEDFNSRFRAKFFVGGNHAMTGANSL